MRSSENLLAVAVLCPFCNAELQLEEKERTEKRFDCPECQRELDFRESATTSDDSEHDGHSAIGFLKIFAFLKQRSPLRKKILFTLGCLVVVRIGYHILLPGIDADALSAWFWRGGDFSPGVQDFRTGFLSRTVLFTLGLAPYVSGAAFLLLLSGFIAPLKRLRDGSTEQQFVFDRLIYVMVMIIALVQSWGVAVFLAPFMLYGVVTFDSPVYWIVLSALVVFMAYLVTAITFSAKKLAAEIEEKGYAIAGMQGDEDVKEYLDGIIERTILPSAVFLFVLTYLPFLLSRWQAVNLRPEFLAFFGPTLLIISAVCLDIFEQMRTEIRMYFKNAVANKERFTEWAPIYFGDTATETEMIRHELARSGIDAIVFSNRVISLAGTLAFWEAARPTYPSLTIHRRLGMGGVSVRVHPDDVEMAHSIVRFPAS